MTTTQFKFFLCGSVFLSFTVSFSNSHAQVSDHIDAELIDDFFEALSSEKSSEKIRHSKTENQKNALSTEELEQVDVSEIVAGFVDSKSDLKKADTQYEDRERNKIYEPLRANEERRRQWRATRDENAEAARREAFQRSQAARQQDNQRYGRDFDRSVNDNNHSNGSSSTRKKSSSRSGSTLKFSDVGSSTANTSGPFKTFYWMQCVGEESRDPRIVHNKPHTYQAWYSSVRTYRQKLGESRMSAKVRDSKTRAFKSLVEADELSDIINESGLTCSMPGMVSESPLSLAQKEDVKKRVEKGRTKRIEGVESQTSYRVFQLQ